MGTGVRGRVEVQGLLVAEIGGVCEATLLIAGPKGNGGVLDVCRG